MAMILHPFDDAEIPPPQCAASVKLVQDVLRSEATPEVLDADPHPATCAQCRELVGLVRAMFSLPQEPVAVPAGFADRVVRSMWAEQHTLTRRRSYTLAIAALAAAVFLAVGLSWYFSSPTVQPAPWLPPGPGDVVAKPEIAPAPREKPDPVRFSDAMAHTGQAILEETKPLADSVAAAPRLFDAIGEWKLPAPVADPMGANLEPARKSLTELPEAARTGLEPVTGTAEKAFARFLRDVGSVKPN